MMNEPTTAWDFISAFLDLRKQVSIGTDELALYVYLLQASEQVNECIDETPFSLLNEPLMASLGINKRTFLAARNRLNQLSVIGYVSGNRNVSPPTYTIMRKNSWCKNAPRNVTNIVPNNVPSNNTIDTIDSNYSNIITNGCKNAPRNVTNNSGCKNAPRNTETLPNTTTHVPPTETTLFYALSNEQYMIKVANEMHYATNATDGLKEIAAVMDAYCRWYCGTYNTGMANKPIGSIKAWEALRAWVLGNKERGLHAGFIAHLQAKYPAKDITTAIEAATLDAAAKGTPIANWQAWAEKFVASQWNNPKKETSTTTTTNTGADKAIRRFVPVAK